MLKGVRAFLNFSQGDFWCETVEFYCPKEIIYYIYIYIYTHIYIYIIYIIRACISYTYIYQIYIVKKQKKIVRCKRNVLYKYIASTPTKTHPTDIGISEDEWKKWYYNHMKSLRNKRYKNEVSLSSYVWKIKNETGKIPTLNGQL